MSDPTREDSIHEAKERGGKWNGMEWDYPVKAKKKKVAQKMRPFDIHKKSAESASGHFRKHGSGYPTKLPF